MHDRTGRTPEPTETKVLPAVALLLAALTVLPACAAPADDTKLLSTVPRFNLHASSHATAAAEVLAFHGVNNDMPPVVLIGGLEARIYRCQCAQNIHLWDVARGARLWCEAQGLKIKTRERILRGGEERQQLRLSEYRAAIDAGQPVVLTYSLDEASAGTMNASFRSQDRVSVVGIGYEQSEQGPYLIALLPEAAENEKRFERLALLPGAAPVPDRPGLLRLAWHLPTGNLLATFIELAPTAPQPPS